MAAKKITRLKPKRRRATLQGTSQSAFAGSSMVTSTEQLQAQEKAQKLKDQEAKKKQEAKAKKNKSKPKDD